jgi:hypothetical protein
MRTLLESLKRGGPLRFLFPYSDMYWARDLIDYVWPAVCKETIRSGDAGPLHAERQDYEQCLLAVLKLLDAYLVLDELHEDRPIKIPTEFKQFRQDLQAHYDSLFPRWQTLEDLEAILLEQVSLSHEELQKIAMNHPPAQSWFDEDFTTLRPETSS